MAEDIAGRRTADDGEQPELLLLKPLPPSWVAEMSARFRLLKPWESPLPFDRFLATRAASVRALFVALCTPVDAATIDLLPSLGCIVNTSTGVDHIDLQACARRGIAVTNAGTVFSKDVADTAVGLLLTVLRRISAADRYVRRGMWPVAGDYPLGAKLGGKRVGIVGLGSIGLETAKRLEAFGCRVSYFSRRLKPSVPYSYFPDVCDLAAESDVLILTCALNSQTHHIINRDVMSALGKDGIIVNVGRGALIDEESLVKLLVEGEIAGAGFDVYEHEPKVPVELLSIDNVVLSPHNAVFTRDSYHDLFQLMLANLEAFFCNKPLLTPVLQFPLHVEDT